MDLNEALVDGWWAAAACRPRVIAESTYRHLRALLDPMTAADARAYAALVTGVEPGAVTGIDVHEVALACGVTTATVDRVLSRLREGGLATVLYRASEFATGREGRAWRLSPGVVAAGGEGRQLRIEPAYDEQRRRLAFRAVPVTAAA